MFYAQYKLKENLKCQICEQMFEIPKILPCGESICDPCAKGIEAHSMSINKVGFDCSFCSEVLEIHAKGFPINKQLDKLLKEESEEIIRGATAIKLKEVLNKIRVTSEDSTRQLKNVVNDVMEHCFSLRNAIQLKTEEKIQFINEKKEQQISTVDSYEKECISKIEDLGESGYSDFRAAVDESKQFCKKWERYLQQLNIEDSQMSQAIEKGSEILFNLKPGSEKLRTSQLSDRTLKFEVNPISKLVLGSLEVSRIFTSINSW